MLRRVVSSLVQVHTSALAQPRCGLKHQVPLTWVRPERVAAYKPQRSGDLEPPPAVAAAAPAPLYALSDQLQDAPESVQKIFSVAHRGRGAYRELVREQLESRVRRHRYDVSTAETRIAKLTAHIRCLQETLEKFPKTITAKTAAQELIDKRKKLLKFLRQYDYKKFEWLLEKLNLEYKAHPDSYHQLSRKESLRRLTELHCADVRDQKLADYRRMLESQQGPFLREKLDALRFIREEQEALRLNVTVTEQDVRRVQRLLDEWAERDRLRHAARRRKTAGVDL